MKLWRLEAIRGLAALYVLAVHAQGRAHFILAPLRFGQEAVMVFFLISGFVIEYAFSSSNKQDFRSYFKRRFARIYVVLIPMLIICSIITRQDIGSAEYWRLIIGNLMMLQDYYAGKPNVIVPTIFASALWSLSYEWWFYMLYHPLRTLLRESAQKRTVVTFSVASALIYTFYPFALPRLIMYFAIWWIGVELARSYKSNGKVEFKDLKISLTTALIISIILAVKCLIEINKLNCCMHPFLEFRHFIGATAAVLTALAWQKAKWKGFGMLKVGTIIAPISYSLYITHQPFVLDASYLGFIGNPWVRYLCYITIMIAFCVITELTLYPWIKKRFANASPNK